MVIPLALQHCNVAEKDSGTAGSAAKANGGFEQAFPGRSGPVKNGFLFGQPVEYREIDGLAVVGGDIVFPEEGLLAAPPLGKEASVGRALGSSRWINNIVYYRFDPAFTGAPAAKAAIAHWEANSSIRFVQWSPALSGHPDYVEFQSVEGDGCFSGGIGRTGGKQIINLDGGCGEGNAIHEIGHAIGLYHEQCRSDQAGSIAIDFNNVPETQRGRFYAFNNVLRAPAPLDGTDFGALDFASIMMDGSYAAAIDPSKPTMTKVSDGSTWPAQRTALSTGDIGGVAAMYPSFWTAIAGKALDVGVGANGAAWIIGSAATTGGYQIFKRSGTSWTLVPGGAVRVDVDKDGYPWVINNAGALFYYTTAWVGREQGRKFLDIGAGSEGSVFGVSQTASGAGFQILKWTGSAWVAFPSGGATRVTVDNFGNPWIVNSAFAVQRWNGTAWETLPGSATDIGAGPDGSVYILENATVAGGQAVALWNGSDWRRVPGGGKSIDVGPGGNPWRLDDLASIFTGTLAPAGTVSPAAVQVPVPMPEGWRSENAFASDIGVGGTAANITAWAISTTDAPVGGKTIYRRAGAGGQWTLIPGASVAVDVDAAGNAWVVSSLGTLFYYNYTAWVGREQSKQFVDIGVSGMTNVFGLVKAAGAADHPVYKWTGSVWSPFPGASGTRITVDNNGNPWVVASTGAIKRWTGTAWENLSGAARDIGAGSDGRVYIVGADNVPGGGTVSLWNGSGWSPIMGGGTAIDVDPAGNPWIANLPGNVYSRIPDPALPPPDPPAPIPGGWLPEAVSASAIGAGGVEGNITAWVLSTTDAPAGGKTIYRKSGLNGQWVPVAGAAVTLDVDAAGNAWVANSAGALCYFNNTGWVGREQGKQFLDIGVNGVNDVYGLVKTAGAQDHPVYKWTGSGWTLFPGASGVRIAVDRKGFPWVVTSTGEIKQWTGTAWEAKPGSARDIDAGTGGAIYKVGTVNVTGGSTVWSWNGAAWIQIAIGAAVVDLDPSGNPWIAKADGSVTRWNPGTALATPPLNPNPDADPAAVPVPPVPPSPPSTSGQWVYLDSPGDVVAFSGSAIPNGYALDNTARGVGGFAVRWFANGQSTLIAKRFVDIDEGRDCEVWAVTDSGTVFFNPDACNSGSAWQAGSAVPSIQFSKIAAARGVNSGDPSLVYALTKEAVTGGFRVMKRIDNANWIVVPGGFIDIDADDNGDLWGVTSRMAAFYMHGNDPLMYWAPMSDASETVGNNLAVGSGRTLCLTATSYILQAWTSTGWAFMMPLESAGFASIQISPSGVTWATDEKHRIWYTTLQYTPGPHPRAPGGSSSNF
ncbi:MAG: hypothetical protein JWP91_1076 [Fibrobacteres bacterium]|nr:hypothetical protein [Fibrobacterota bacterium]